MSGIITRTAFVDNEKGYWRFHDFCLVQTSLGTMVEWDAPFQRASINQTSAYDPSDQTTKVNRVESMSMDKRPDIFRDGAITLHELWYYKEGY